MAIKILSPQLANQIAAGEVVERPASVVKELVENSLDAGATQIHIDIENGGASLIRIRDNGSGIGKDELALALARHATSKISDLEDLENILSLGFRGEALASISSVSRLTLTSRTAEQKEAWQVYAQGREMETTIKPASHPVGTTVEVANLFFNTPARRKFLRTDKTEFAHIDEVIRRIALAKFNIAFTLTHNQKIIRQYRAAADLSQQLKRVATICGQDFVQHALRIDWKHNDLHLSGWVADPHFSRAQNDLAYCYINGRMVRDKVITHAIRQAYAQHLGAEQYPAFVLFIDLNPQEVDVNVHPTKHEVRFHQQRLIHDFIEQGISHALSNYVQPTLAANNYDDNAVREPIPHFSSAQGKPNRAAAGKNIFSEADYVPQSERPPVSKLRENPPHFSASRSAFSSSGSGFSGYSTRSAQNKGHSAPSKIERESYQALLSQGETELPMPLAQNDKSTQSPPLNLASEVEHFSDSSNQDVLRALALVKQQALLLQRQGEFYLLKLSQLQRLNIQLMLQKNEITQQPLLIPVVFRLNENQFAQWQKQQDFFRQAGFELVENASQQRLTLNRLPLCLRNQNMQQLIISLLEADFPHFSDFLDQLIAQLTLKPVETFADALRLLGETERLLSKETEPLLHDLLYLIHWDNHLSAL